MKRVRKKIYKYSIIGSTLFLLTITSLGISLQSGCTPVLSEEEQRKVNIKKDMQNNPMNRAVFTESLKCEQVVNCALKHNLQNRLLEKEQDIKKELANQAWFKMLPSLKASADKARRNQPNASSSVDLITRKESLTSSYSADSGSRSLKLDAVWNILDFGISFFSARQADNRILLGEQDIRRSRQKLALDTYKSYWTAVVADWAAGESGDLIEDLDERLGGVDSRLDDNTISKSQGLRTKKDLLTIQQRLKAYPKESEAARNELARLMGVGGSSGFSLTPVAFPTVKKFYKYNALKLQREALRNRPELFKYDIEERISEDQMRISALKVLPSPAVMLDHNWDKDPHLYSSYWYTTGVNVSWNLLEIPLHVKERQTAKLQHKLANQQRLAVAVAILTQVNITLIEYEEAINRIISAGEVRKIQNELLDVSSGMFSEGRLSEAALLSTKIDTFFAELSYLQAYTHLLTTIGKIKSAIGRDPVVSKRPLPVVMVQTIEEHKGESKGENVLARLKAEELARMRKFIDIQKTYGIHGTYYAGMPELKIEKKKAAPVQEGTASAEVPEKAEVTDGSLKDLAAMLDNRSNNEANAAKEKLIEAGEAGAEAAITMLTSGDRNARERAIHIVSKAGTKEQAAALVVALQDKYSRNRFYASLALKEKFQQDFGYRYNSSSRDRTAAYARWQAFIEKQKLTDSGVKK
ncbi:MAG: TolC family protein [Planctomycetota bacterium]